MSISKDGFIFKLSTRPHKKYDVFKNNKYILSFGDSRYQHYFDRIGLLPKWMNHRDKERRARYYNRHGYTKDTSSAKFFSNKYLW